MKEPEPLTVKEFEYLEKQRKAMRELQGDKRYFKFMSLLNKQTAWLQRQDGQVKKIHAGKGGKS